MGPGNGWEEDDYGVCEFSSAGATDLNLGFTRFWLPAGATLHVVAEGENYAQGPYSSRDNKPHGQLWSAVVPGEAAVVELFVPAESRPEPILLLGQVGTGYLDVFHRKAKEDAAKASGTNVIGWCGIDVNCPEGDPWRNEMRSVGSYTIGGSSICTGTLIGNTGMDSRNLFLTANHCTLTPENAPTVVVYWNYESPACGMLSGGSRSQNQSGAIFRAARADVDFALIELEDAPDPSFNVYYAGWDRSGVPVGGVVGIHHPRGKEKCISISSNLLTTINKCTSDGVAGLNTHWNVAWTVGITENGSSGSGIWDLGARSYVGFLSGGASACGGTTQTDCYGKLALAWDGTSPATRLRDWLDPLNRGFVSILGMNQAPLPALTGTGSLLVREGCTPTNGMVDPDETVTVSLALRNLSAVRATNVVATLLMSGGVTAPSGPQTYGLLAPGGTPVWREYTFTANGMCGDRVTATLQLQDGDRDLGTAVFSLATGHPRRTPVSSENFDGVVAPGLPAGWVSTPASAWVTASNLWDTGWNAAFTTNLSTISDQQLVSPTFTLNSSDAEVTFRHRYRAEFRSVNGGRVAYDGGVLEVSTDNGAFMDILDAGGTFRSGGYNYRLATGYSNPLGGRWGWGTDSEVFVTTIVTLPKGNPGRSVRLRWRFGSDRSFGSLGWFVDTMSLSLVEYECCAGPARPQMVDVRRDSSNKMAFSYDSVAGQTYVVQGSSNLVSANWIPLQTNAGDSTRKSYTNSVSGKERFFRVETR